MQGDFRKPIQACGHCGKVAVISHTVVDWWNQEFKSFCSDCAAQSLKLWVVYEEGSGTLQHLEDFFNRAVEDSKTRRDADGNWIESVKDQDGS